MKLKLEMGDTGEATRLMTEDGQLIEGVRRVYKVWSPGDHTHYVIEVLHDSLIEVPNDSNPA